MKAAAILKWLRPKEGRFQELLDLDTANLVKGAGLFAEIAASRSLADRRVKWVELKKIEHEGDGLTRQIFDALNSTFITPLDREDIRSIGTDLDDILDYLEAVAHDLVLFELEESPEALRQFADILVKTVAEIALITSLVWDLGNETRIREGMVRISDFENQADQLYAAVIADLFRDSRRNAIEVLKWKEVYEGLEDACDQCKDYTHIVGNVVVKNS
jgi:predicted phosphate transport protein (TIGR00153 family)